MSGARLYWRTMIACIVVDGDGGGTGDRTRELAGLLSGRFSRRMEIEAGRRLYIDLGREQRRLGNATSLAASLAGAVSEIVGGGGAIGLAGDRSTARVAAETAVGTKRVRVVPPWESRRFLRWRPVDDLLPVGPLMKRFLDERGIVYCGQMRRLTLDEVGRRFGRFGRLLWLASQGRDPRGLRIADRRPASIGHGLLFAVPVRGAEALVAALERTSLRVVDRLERMGLVASSFDIVLGARDGTAIESVWRTAAPGGSPDELFAALRNFVDTAWDGRRIAQVYLTARDLVPADRSPRPRNGDGRYAPALAGDLSTAP